MNLNGIEECDNMDDCNHFCEVVPYNSLRGVGHPENLGWMYWPMCISQKTLNKVKLNFDIEAGRYYKGARR